MAQQEQSNHVEREAAALNLGTGECTVEARAPLRPLADCFWPLTTRHHRLLGLDVSLQRHCSRLVCSRCTCDQASSSAYACAGRAPRPTSAAVTARRLPRCCSRDRPQTRRRRAVPSTPTRPVHRATQLAQRARDRNPARTRQSQKRPRRESRADSCGGGERGADTE